MGKNDGEKEEAGEETKGSQGRKRARETTGSQSSQTDEDSHSCSCHNMAATIEAINQKLDLALSRFQEIDDLKEKLTDLQKENNDLKDSLSNAHTEIAEFKKAIAAQEGTIQALQKGVSGLQKDVKSEKERAIRLESHSRRNNLNFFNIPEVAEESFAKTECILRNFMDKELRVENAKEISIERAHRVGKPRSDGKPRPIIAKFSFFKDKDFVLSKAPILAGTNFGVSLDFPKEIVDIRKSLLPHLKAARKRGCTAKLVYDKLYIDDQLFQENR